MIRYAFYILAILIGFGAPARADLKCGGTEPFWGLVIGSNKATYENMGEGLKAEFDAVMLQDAQGLKPGHMRKYLLKNAKTPAEAMVLKKKCNDGMSDVTYPYTIAFTYKGIVFAGCCR